MADQRDIEAEFQRLVERRLNLESRLQKVQGDLSAEALDEHDHAYAGIQLGLLKLFKASSGDPERIKIMLEVIRIMENKLVYLQNFVIEPTPENRKLASLVGDFVLDMGSTADGLTQLEVTYYTGVTSLYAGEIDRAREAFRQACESEESDEANDIKFKSYVILGNLTHERHEYEAARALHDESLRYSQNNNVTAQALALKALNSYALKEYDDALAMFEESLQLFDREEAFFNSYFHRNALLFSASIYSQRKEYARAESYYRQVLDEAQPDSYDHFDALSQLGRIYYSTDRYDEAARTFSEAIATHNATENEYLVDTYFWLARTHIKQDDAVAARTYLEKIAASDVKYERRGQAEEMLARVS
ncbi:MAG TPA: tetratricopeptide repeat protein [Thermoanaerobaculia bacterium]|nr:tetratricopeptide repeat protein [Thermoanaerobaculia bacterium]